MSKTNESSIEIFNQYCNSRQPIIYLETFEEPRVIKEIVYQLNVNVQEENDKKNIFCFDYQRGITLVSVDKDDNLVFKELDQKLLESLTRPKTSGESPALDPQVLNAFNRPFQLPALQTQQAITFAKALTIPSVFIFADIHGELNQKTGSYSPRTVRGIKDLAYAIVYEQQAYYKTIAILSPTLTIPTEIDKLVQVISFELPKRDKLSVKLQAMLDVLLEEQLASAHTKEEESYIRSILVLTSEKKHEVIQAGLGLTEAEFEQAIKFSIVSKYRVDPVVIQNFKESIIKKSGKLEFVKPTPIENLGGLDLFKEELEMESWALTEEAAELGVNLTKGFLCVGFAGTGKSLGAKCASAKLGIPLLRMDMNLIMGSLVGESEKNIREAFAIAEALAPCIFQIDEIEKAMAGLESSGKSDSGTTSRVIQTILTQMSETTSQILFFGTCNDYDALPPELKRRFAKIVFFDYPDNQAREEILKIHLLKNRNDKQKDHSLEQFDIPVLVEASRGFTPAEIETTIIRGFMRGGYKTKSLNTESIVEYMRKITPMSQRERDNPKFKKLRDTIKYEAEPASSRTLETELQELIESESLSKKEGSGIKAKPKLKLS